jgi:hypothetical protein
MLRVAFVGGTPHDVTLQEIRVECLFPMNEETARIFHHWPRAH